MAQICEVENKPRIQGMYFELSKLMDISERKQVVAEGRVHSTDPNQMVHFVRLGPNAARVWVDVVLVDDANVWRKSDEMESLKDAHGSSIAWPLDKLVIF